MEKVVITVRKSSENINEKALFYEGEQTIDKKTYRVYNTHIMKKGIATLSIIISMFVLGLFLVPQHKASADWGISIGFEIGHGSSYSSYDDYDYGYDDDYGYNDYSYPSSYGYGNNYYSYPSYSTYDNCGCGSQYGYAPIAPRYGMYNTSMYDSYYNPYAYSGYGNGYGSSYPVCMTRTCR